MQELLKRKKIGKPGESEGSYADLSLADRVPEVDEQMSALDRAILSAKMLAANAAAAKAANVPQPQQHRKSSYGRCGC